MSLQIQMIPITPLEGKVADPAKMFVAIEGATRDEAAEGVRYMSEYPAISRNSTYVRTGTLRRSWSFEVKTGGGRIEGIIGSNSSVAPYNAEVQGVKQSRMFSQVGWRNINDLQRDVDRDFPKRVQNAINKAFN